MREIKFRGKSIFSKEWVYGSYVPTNENKHFIIEMNYIGKIIKSCQVVKDSVGQFTEMNDGTNKPIYEHDILSDPKDNHVWVVDYYKGVYMVKFGIKNYEYSFLNDVYTSDIMIIGNKIDSPELITWMQPVS